MRISTLVGIVPLLSLAVAIRRARDDYPAIAVPSINDPSYLNPGEVSYQANSNMFSMDLGALGNYNSPVSKSKSTPSPADYGMVSQNFAGPSVSFARNLTHYQPPSLKIAGCQPSGNNGKCVQGGESSVGISLPSFYKAKLSR